VARFYENDSEASGSIEGDEFLHYLIGLHHGFF